jgi:hypothetical protein
MSFTDIEKRHLKHERDGGASRCPLCLSEEIERYAVSTAGGRAEQPMGCNACGAGWTEAYTMSQVTICYLGKPGEL